MRTTPRVAGFRSEYPAGFELECMAGFVGIRTMERIAEAEAARLAAEEGAKGAVEERDIYAQLAAEAEAAQNQLRQLVAQLQAAPKPALQESTEAFSAAIPPAQYARYQPRAFQLRELAEQLFEWQTAATSSPASEKQAVLISASAATEAIDLDEADTRQLIDEQLRERGWEADTINLRYAKRRTRTR
ncbi:hypothetical protein ACVWZV_009239 [Bradyrhizobium sp. GM5.1]